MQEPSGSEHVGLNLPSPMGDGSEVRVEGELATYSSQFKGKVTDPLTAIADSVSREFNFLSSDEDGWTKAAAGIAAKLAEQGYAVVRIT